MTELGPPYKSGHHRKITDSFSKAISHLEKLISTNLILKKLTMFMRRLDFLYSMLGVVNWSVKFY